jgi:hypothetical protein
MKGFTSFAAAFIGTLAGAQQVGTDIVWEKDLATAMAKSRETGRPVMAYFTFET